MVVFVIVGGCFCYCGRLYFYYVGVVFVIVRIVFVV